MVYLPKIQVILLLAMSLLMVYQICYCSTTPSSAKKLTANQYLRRYGYMANYYGTSPNKMKNAVREFQAYAKLPVTGAMDEATVAMLTGPRCGASYTAKKPSRLKRYVKQGSTWKKMNLSWSVHGSPQPRAKISSETVRVTMAKSFKMWEDVSKLSFRRLADNDSNADIIIKFSAGNHSDGYPFDGRGGQVGHAFYPGNNAGLAGDIHFDDDEIWTINGEQKTIDYTWAALHQIGHALGLGHSREQDAIMWPFFTVYKPDTRLAQDDINGIQDIYGNQPSTHSAVDTVYEISTPSPSPTFPVNVTAKSSIASRKLIIIATSASAGVMFIVMLAVLIVIYKRRTKAANLSIPVDISQEQGYEMAGATDPPFYEEVDAKPDQSQLFRFSKLDENRQAENDNPFQKLSKAEKAPAAEDRSSTYEEVDILSNAHKETGYTVLGVRETTNTSDYQALLKEEPQYEIPATCQPEAYEEVITLPHSSGYTELEKNRQRRKSEDNVYQKLIQRDSGYVIPADTRRESYEDIQPTKIKPGTTSIG